jgi:hypothetical protein
MSLILAKTSDKPKPRVLTPREISSQKRGRLVQKRVIIKNDQKLLELFNWMFKVLKDLGFYPDKKTHANSLEINDNRVGKLLGISGDMVKRYRIRAGYIPNARIINRLKDLEKASKIETKITKLKRKRKVNVR